jgi:hypothetical protein
MGSSDGLLFVYSDPGTIPVTEFNDWYDNEHGPARLTVPGISAGYRFRALDGQAPSWLAYYELKSGVLDSPEYKALWAAASAREKSIMSALGTLDRRVYELISDSGPDVGPGVAEGAPAVVLAVSLSVPPAMEDDLAAWYADEHIPMLLAVPGWQRIRRYRLTAGTAPAYLSLHSLASTAVFDEPGYRAAVTTPRQKRIVDAAIGRERRVFGLHKSFG